MSPVDTERQVVSLPASKLRPHPENPRGHEVLAGHVQDLVQLISVHGQQQPCVVRPFPEKKPGSGGPDYEILLGHRRTVACSVLNRDVQCLVLEDCTDEEASAIMLADNPSHVAPDPLQEAAAVEAFRKRTGWTLQAIAECMGKSPAWVARRAQLVNLAPEVRKRLRPSRGEKVHGDEHLDAVRDWPVSWLERVAVLQPDVQAGVVSQAGWIRSEPQLQRHIAGFTRSLAQAPWDLADATLVPEAGACGACPKQSGRCPGLFDDGTKEVPVGRAQCLDSSCWDRKRAAHAARVVKAARAEHPDLVALEGQGGDRLEAKGLRAYTEWDVTPAKRGDRGALPALVLQGKGQGDIRWVRPKPAVVKEEKAKAAARSTAAKVAARAKKKQTPAAVFKQRVQEAKARRTAWVREEFVRRIQKHEPNLASPARKTGVLALAAIVGCMPALERRPGGESKLLHEAAAGKRDLDDLWQALWVGVRLYVADEFDYRDFDGQATRDIAYLAGFDLGALELEALKKIPDPAAPALMETPAAKPSKKRGARKGPVADTPDSAASPAGSAGE